MMDFVAADAQIGALEACVKKTRKITPGEKLYVGVDLGTAYIVLVVLNSKKKPVACAMQFAQVIRDGIVVDYVGAGRIVRELKARLEERLHCELTHAAIAVPPGTDERTSATHRHVAEGAGFEVTGVLDEPTAANAVLHIKDGAIVDIGGGTTGLSVLKDGKVVYVADEATGGTHLSLVLAGNYNVSLEEAEGIKTDPKRQKEIMPVVRPVLQKMGTIIARHIAGRDVQAIYLVGGTCCLTDMEKEIAKEVGIPVYKPANPFLVTPLGIALNCEW
ncbi:ethanolamine utilization protein EutJ [Desulfovibrio sp. OttesenSCG-928-G15]|nr:ethanolamine utilization protein EutJ [Desulfovibrio sp. OttesenSCG-928-G15]